MRMIRFGAVLAAAALTVSAVEAMQVSFAGGTVKEYLATLKEIDPDIRLVVHPDAERFEMPAVEFTDISVQAAIEAAARLHAAMDVQIVSDHREPGSIEHATYILRVDPRDMAEALEANAAGRNFDLDFPGGTMKEFVHTLRDVADANILLRPEANDVQVPELMLRGADVHNLMVTMSGRLQAPEGARGELDIDWTTTDGAERLLYVVEIESASDAAERRAPRVHHWALGAITEETPVTAEDVLGAIEVAQEFFESEVIVRYHEPTRTLIAKGLESDLEVIDQLIDRIEGSAVFLDQDE